MLSELVDRLTGRSDDGGPDTSTARGRDALLAERDRELGAELEDARRQLQKREAAVPGAAAAGDADGAEGRMERLELRARVEDLERGREAVREAREALRPDLLDEERLEAAQECRQALREATKRAEKLGRATDRLFAEHAGPLAEAYDRAVEASQRARECRRELSNDHNRQVEREAPGYLDRRLRRAASNGWQALRSLQDYARKRRD